MKGLYQGQIHPNAQKLDLADIRVVDFLQKLDKSLITDKEKELVEKLVNVIEESNTDVTFNDDRYVLIATKLTRNVSFADADFTYFLFANRNLIAFYSQSIPQVKNLVDFMTMFIGLSINQENITDYQLSEYQKLADSVLADPSSEMVKLLPLYVKEALSDAKDFVVGQTINVKGVNEIDIAPPVNVVADEQTGLPKVQETIPEATDEVAEWQETIELLQSLIDEEPNASDVPEWQETIELLQDLIAERKLQKGGRVNVKKLVMRKLAKM